MTRKRATGRSAGLLLVPALVAWLLLPGCSREVTSVQVVVSFTLSLDKISLTGSIDGTSLFSDRRFPERAGALVSGQDVVVLLPDEDDGRTLEVEVKGLRKALAVATATGRVTVVKGKMVRLEIDLGSSGKDSGPDDAPSDRKVLPTDVPLPPDLPDSGCTVGISYCSGKYIVSCVATEAGVVQVTEYCPLGCVTAAPVKCREIVPSNQIPAAMLQAGTDDFKPSSGLVTINTDSAQISGDNAKPVTISITQTAPGPTILVMAFKSVHIPQTVAVRVEGSKALALFAAAEIKVEGVIDSVGQQGTPGAGGGQGGSQTQTAQGPGIGSAGSYLSYFIPPSTIYHLTSGGGGAGYGDTGSKGGAGQYSSGTTPGGIGGPIYGNGTLVPLEGGSGGRRGGAYSSSCAVSGGGGGGALQLVSRSSIVVGAATGGGGINVGGGGGAPPSGAWCAGGGGGSGGGILLEAPAVTVMSGATLAANGGGGSGGSGTIVGATAGAAGGLSDQPAAGGIKSGSGGNGGAGGAASGIKQSGEEGDSAIAGGGGGGSVGHIRINTETGTAVIAGTISGVKSEGKVSTLPP